MVTVPKKSDVSHRYGHRGYLTSSTVGKTLRESVEAKGGPAPAS